MKVYIVAIVDYDEYIIKSIHATWWGAVIAWSQLRDERIKEEEERISRWIVDDPQYVCEILEEINRLKGLTPTRDYTQVSDRPIIEEYDLEE